MLALGGALIEVQRLMPGAMPAGQSYRISNYQPRPIGV
jgi:hypothetical protein